MTSRSPSGIIRTPGCLTWRESAAGGENRNYPAKHGALAWPCDLRAHDLTGIHNGESLTLWELVNGNQDFTVHPNARFLTNDYWAAKLAAIHDHGICFIPDFFAETEVSEGILEPVLPEWRSREVPMYALFPSHRLNNPNRRLLIGALSKHFGDVFCYLYTATRNEALARTL